MFLFIFSLVLEREEVRGRDMWIGCLLHAPPLGIKPETRACALPQNNNGLNKNESANKSRNRQSRVHEPSPAPIRDLLERFVLPSMWLPFSRSPLGSRWPWKFQSLCLCCSWPQGKAKEGKKTSSQQRSSF